jgi:hypothetical protein
VKVIWQSTKFDPHKVVSVYARLYSNGEVKVFDVDGRHKTIREWWTTRDAFSGATLRLGEQVLVSGLTTQERDCNLRHQRRSMK